MQPPVLATPDVEEQTETTVEEKLSPLWRVICHDDPHTTMDFVLETFRTVFRMTAQRAMERMLQVHYTGAAVIARYPRSVAEKRVNKATAKARSAGYPLAFTIEPDD